jgi:hypothetical protein
MVASRNWTVSLWDQKSDRDILASVIQGEARTAQGQFWFRPKVSSQPLALDPIRFGTSSRVQSSNAGANLSAPSNTRRYLEMRPPQLGRGILVNHVSQRAMSRRWPREERSIELGRMLERSYVAMTSRVSKVEALRLNIGQP